MTKVKLKVKIQKLKETFHLNKKENAVSKSVISDTLPDVKLFSDNNVFLQNGIEVEKEEEEMNQ